MIAVSYTHLTIVRDQIKLSINDLPAFFKLLPAVHQIACKRIVAVLFAAVIPVIPDEPCALLSSLTFNQTRIRLNQKTGIRGILAQDL